MQFLQPSMSGGELSPGLRGRVDTVRYAISLELCRNCYTKPTGGVVARPGRRFRGRAKYGDRITRQIEFIYNTEVKYLVEVGHQYFRFWVDGALLTNSTKTVTGITQASPAVVTAPAHGFSTGDYVLMSGVQGMTRINDRTFQITVIDPNSFSLDGLNATGYAAYTSGGAAARVVEVATPYTESIVPTIRYTQSADVLFMVTGNIRPKELRRLTSTSFELRDFNFRRGPFRAFNSDEARIMAVSGTQGVVTVTTNVDTFDPAMVGGLIYLEEKELRGVKPWASAEKNVPLGALRRSDQKVCRASEVPVVVGPAYYITGATRPVHSSGRGYDGPQDIKNDGVNNYTVGVEWEFVHNTFGIVQITAVTDARTATALVIERVPDSIVGTAPSPGNTWTFSGDGVTTQFSTPGSTSSAVTDYQVTIDGTPVQSNPNYPGGGGIGCPDVNEVLPCGRRAGDIKAGDNILVYDPETGEESVDEVTHSDTKPALRFRIVTAAGKSMVCSDTAQLRIREGGYRNPMHILHREVCVRINGQACWAEVAEVQDLGMGQVQHISVNGKDYWVGDMLHHNRKPDQVFD